MNSPRLRPPVRALAFVVVAGSSWLSAANAGVIYSTGFESPGFTVGPLSGQGGFEVSPPNIPDPLTVTTSGPHSGSQDVGINGADLTDVASGTPLFLQASDLIPLNYDAIANGTPVVTIEAFLKLNGPSTDTGNGTADDLVSVNLEALTGSFDPSTYAGYYSNYLSSDGQAQAFTTGYGPSVPVTLGEYHDLKIALDFANRTSTFTVDGVTSGTVAFDPADTSNVLSSVQLSFYSYVTSGPNDPNDPQTVAVNPADYSASIDDLTVTAVPEPSTLISGATGLAVLGLIRLSVRRKRRSVPVVRP